MMIDLSGKGMFTWVIPDCEGGDVDAIIARAKEAQLTFLMPKITNGTKSYDLNAPYLEEFVDKCHAAEIKVIAWSYVYGNSPVLEAQVAATEYLKYSYDGYLINAEHEYKNRPSQARAFCIELRKHLPDEFIGLSSYRYPDYHPEFPWNEFLQYCDVNMPQVYWEQADGTAASQLDRCIALFTDPEYIQRPIMPTGSAYTNAGWVAKPQDIIDFIERADELGLDAISFWEWRYPRSRFPELWDAIVDTSFGEYEEPEMPDMEWNGTYKIVLNGSMAIHETNLLSSRVVGYAYSGEEYIATEKTADDIYKIGDERWISGRTRWTVINKVLIPVPHPEPELSLEQKVELLWDAHPELH
jgi:hypothetical protein